MYVNLVGDREADIKNTMKKDMTGIKKLPLI